MIVPLPKQETPAAPAQVPQEEGNRIPYDRFQEVVHQKNALAEETAKLRQTLAQVSSTLNPNQSPQFETAEQLTRYIEEKTNKNVQEQIQAAYQQYIAPIQQERMLSAYGNGVEKFFASDPQASAIRAEMDRETALLPEWKKQAVIQGVMNGDYELLNNIKARVLESRAKEVQNQTNNYLHGSVPMAQAPQAFRTVGTIPASKHDLIQNAKQTKDWSGVFNSLGDIPNS
jgi:hypothetical protein